MRGKKAKLLRRVAKETNTNYDLVKEGYKRGNKTRKQHITREFTRLLTVLNDPTSIWNQSSSKAGSKGSQNN